MLGGCVHSSLAELPTGWLGAQGDEPGGEAPQFCTALKVDAGWKPLFSLFGMRGEECRVLVLDHAFTVDAGPGFRLTADGSVVAGARQRPEVQSKPWSRGIHITGKRKWLVNGSGSDIVELHFDPPVHASTFGISITVQTLEISVADPQDLLAALSGYTDP